MANEPTDEEIAHNISLWHWYPLGQVDAIWNMIEHLSAQVDGEYTKEIGAVFDALQKLDTRIRADRYTLPKKRIEELMKTRKKRVPARPHLENGGRREIKR